MAETSPPWVEISRMNREDRYDAAGVVGTKTVSIPDDALLVCSSERSQDVKKIVESLEKEGRVDLL